MTRISFVADPHIGNHKKNGGPMTAGINWRCGLSLDAFRGAVDHAASQDADALVVLGDLADYSKLEPSVVRAVQDAIGDHPVLLLVGNHDQSSTEPGNNALAPLEPVATVVEQPMVQRVGDVDLFVVPFQPGPARKWLPGVVSQLALEAPLPTEQTVRVLCVHLGISDGDTPYFLDGADDSISVDRLRAVMRECGISYAFAGNWHRHETWEADPCKVIQVGTLAPNRFSDDGLTAFGRVSTLDTEATAVRHHVVPGPRFVYAVGLSKLQELLTAVQGVSPQDLGALHVFVKVRLKAGEWEQGMALVKQLPDWMTADVEGDASEAKEQAKAAAANARAAVTLDQAVRAYVETMPLEDGVQREDVLRMAKGYMDNL